MANFRFLTLHHLDRHQNLSICSLCQYQHFSKYNQYPSTTFFILPTNKKKQIQASNYTTSLAEGTVYYNVIYFRPSEIDCNNHNDCGGDMLWCRNNLCMAKIRVRETIGIRTRNLASELTVKIKSTVENQMKEV